MRSTRRAFRGLGTIIGLALAPAVLLAFAACGGDDTAQPPAPGAGDDAGANPPRQEGGAHDTGSSSDGATGPDAGPGPRDAGPDARFDTSGLTVTGTPGAAMCVLTTDGRSLRVTITNQGTLTVPPTTVAVASTGTSYALRLDTPPLAPGKSAELAFDRGPLVGFVADWPFTVTIDPDAERGPAHAAVAGECFDLRSRAVAGMVPLATWYDASTGLWNSTDWWTSANQLETVIDFSRETGDTTYASEIDNTFTHNSSNDFDKYGYYDDDGWWALAWIKAYDLSHQQKYLDMAKTIFARMAGGWDSKCGGGIYWASAKAGSDGLKNKNAIPNELFLTVAARLHLRTPGDTGAGSYLDWAQREWAWFKGTGMIGADSRIVDGLDDLTACKPSGPVFTYNQGVVLGGLVDLAASTGDATLITQAVDIAHATMSKMSNADGVLVETPCGGDICVQFKGVYMRNLAYLYEAHPLADVQAYLRKQSDVLWTTSTKDAKNEFGYAWESAFDKATASRQSSALDALVGAVRGGNMNLAIGATASGSAACSAAESADRVADGASNWGSKWCSGGAGGQSVTLDLGALRDVVGFRVRHAGAGGENPAWNTRDFEILTSTDGATWTPAVTVTGNTADVTTHPVPLVSARYVQLHVTTAQTAPDTQAARIYELEAYGWTW